MITPFTLLESPEKLPINVKNVITKLPRLALKPWQKLPWSVQRFALKKALTQVFGQVIADGELDFLLNRTLLINIDDVPYQFLLTVNEQNQLDVLASDNSEQPDVCFQANINSLLLLMNQQIDPDTLFFQRKLLVTGDTELGLAIKNFLDDIDLSHLPKIALQALEHYCQLLAE